MDFLRKLLSLAWRQLLGSAQGTVWRPSKFSFHAMQVLALPKGKGLISDPKHCLPGMENGSGGLCCDQYITDGLVGLPVRGSGQCGHMAWGESQLVL